MAEAFMGYLLPWGQMSYWGAQVIVNLFSAIPVIGPDLALLIRGDYVVGDATLNRFFSFHVIAVPLVLLGLVVAHLLALHDVGSNNPDGVEIKGPNAPKDANGKPLDGVPFHPYYTVHDIFGVGVFLLAFTAIVFFAPEFRRRKEMQNNVQRHSILSSVITVMDGCIAGILFLPALFVIILLLTLLLLLGLILEQ